jgi:hypothetical protein
MIAEAAVFHGEQRIDEMIGHLGELHRFRDAAAAARERCAIHGVKDERPFGRRLQLAERIVSERRHQGEGRCDEEARYEETICAGRQQTPKPPRAGACPGAQLRRLWRCGVDGLRPAR